MRESVLEAIRCINTTAEIRIRDIQETRAGIVGRLLSLEEQGGLPDRDAEAIIAFFHEQARKKCPPDCPMKRDTDT